MKVLKCNFNTVFNNVTVVTSSLLEQNYEPKQKGLMKSPSLMTVDRLQLGRWGVSALTPSDGQGC